MTEQLIKEGKTGVGLFMFDLLLKLKNKFNEETALINSEELVFNFKLLQLLELLYEQDVIDNSRYNSHKDDINRVLDRYASQNFLKSRKELLELLNSGTDLPRSLGKLPEGAKSGT